MAMHLVSTLQLLTRATYVRTWKALSFANEPFFNFLPDHCYWLPITCRPEGKKCKNWVTPFAFELPSFRNGAI